MGTCIQQVDLFYSEGLHRTGLSHSQHRKNSGEVLGKNGDEWTGRVEISKEETPGSKRSMHGSILTYSRL